MSWILTTSLQTRLPSVNYGGDTVMRLLLFWLIFIPWPAREGAGWKQAAARGANQSWAFTVQVLMIYLFTALLKSGADWRVDGSALQKALSIESLRTPFGSYLYHTLPPVLFKVGTWLALFWEEVGALFAVLLPHHSWKRLWTVLAMMLFHLSITILLFLPYFQFVMIAMWSAFLPSCLWDRLGERWSRFSISSDANIPDTINPKRVSITQWALVGLSGYCLFWNFTTLPLPMNSKVPESFRVLGYALRLDQHWGLFAANVRTLDGWPLVVAERSDGSEIILNGYGDAKATFQRPVPLSSAYRSKMWREYQTSLYIQRHHVMLKAYVTWVVDEWNTAHPDEAIRHPRLIYNLVDGLHPEQEVRRVQMYPPKEIEKNGKCVFFNDLETKPSSTVQPSK